jgi:hypothetical protein
MVQLVLQEQIQVLVQVVFQIQQVLQEQQVQVVLIALLVHLA